MTINYVKVSKESANDTEVILQKILVEDGALVAEGDLVIEVEGQKTVYELIAPNAGYIYFKEGLEIDSECQVDEVVALISDCKLEKLEIADKFANLVIVNSEPLEPIALSFSKKIYDRKQPVKRIGVIGGGRGLSQIIEINQSLDEEFEIVCIYDDGLFGDLKQKYGIPIVGKVDYDSIIEDYNFEFIDGLIVSVSTNNSFRKQCFDSLSAKIPFANFIHSTVAMPKNIDLGSGNVVLPFVHLGINCHLGDNNFISSFCNIEHHCLVGSHNTFGPNVTMSGGVEVGDSVKFGTGIFLEPKVKVMSDQFVKSSQLINKDI
tara:strand:+ start:1259 stop:2215 length:957 start_codon:yes stop_codon:yes gene_type:complete